MQSHDDRSAEEKRRRYTEEAPAPKSRVLHTRITEKIYSMVKKAAEIDRRTVSNWVADGLEELAKRTIDKAKASRR